MSVETRYSARYKNANINDLFREFDNFHIICDLKNPLLTHKRLTVHRDHAELYDCHVIRKLRYKI